MKYKIGSNEYDVIVTRKNNKNTYIRVKNDLKIYVTTSYFVTNNQIKKLLDDNINYLVKSLSRQKKKQEKENTFCFLGNNYDIIWMPSVKIDIIENRIYAKNQKTLDNWLKKQMQTIYQEELDKIYNLFEEKIPYPNLKIRTMKTRWGVCNRKNNNVTLNSELIKYSIDKLDYVIVHELSHFVHFNHSVSFWNEVSKYCPNYKQIRKELKE